MEVVGAIASIITLVELGKKLKESLDKVKEHALLVRVELIIARNAQDSDKPTQASRCRD
jgi:hypothetical protein